MSEPDQTAKIHNEDDASLIELFKNPEVMFTTQKPTIDWSKATEFHVFGEFLIKDIQEIRRRLKNAEDEYLYYVCRHIFNILDWIKLMVDQGFSTFTGAFEHLFDEHFGEKNILQNTYDVCFERWISQKSGQYKIGENLYNILKGKIYYRNRFCQWFEVNRKTAFDLKPEKELIKDNDTIDKLNAEYKETWYDAILKQWKNKQYQGALPDDFLQFADKETCPEEYFDFTLRHIKTLIKNPISIEEFKRWSRDKTVDLEYIVKISALVLDMAKKRREEDSHTLYLLRDCLMFYEAHKTIDILSGKDTSAEQILIGRKLLNHRMREWGYYVLTLEAFYNAYKRYPTNFNEFYNEYARLMDMIVSFNPEFATIIIDLADYIKGHVQTDKNKMVVFDIGFQGSIALFTKYIIDHHINPSDPNGKIETDVKIGIVAEWLKIMFNDRFDGDYFPFLNRVQLMATNDELYHYKDGSLGSGKLQVVMGNKEWQHKAAIELVVLVIVTLLDQKDK